MGSLSSLYKTWSQYESAQAGYEDAADSYTRPKPDLIGNAPNFGYSEGVQEQAPIQVDFDMLSETCPDIQGWIYCEDTAINYPIVQGRDNDQYLRHDYLGNYSVAGSIFLEAANAPGFADSNTVIYGHHMKDKSMFACLSSWADQDFYEAHPVMYLLTPDQDYKIELFSGYVTPAGSDTYAVFQGPSEYLDKYLDQALSLSDFTCDPEFVLDGGAKYVLLSTCDYTYQDARYVIHGKLVPIGG